MTSRASYVRLLSVVNRDLVRADPSWVGRTQGPGGHRRQSVDVLVVGYGRAGRAAADRALQGGADVLAVDSGPAGRSGQEGVLAAKARFLSPDEVELTGLGTGAAADPTVVRAGRVIVATGSCPAYPQVGGLADARFMIGAAAHRLLPSDIPLGPADGPLRRVATLRPGKGPLPFALSDLADRSVAVLGAGRTGCTVAWALGVLGAQVTLVEEASTVLPRLDPLLAGKVLTALQDANVRVMLTARASGLAPTLDEGVWIGTEQAGDVAAEHLVLATGHSPLTTGLDLRAAGVLVDSSGAVRVDDRCRTTADTVLAAGEVTGCSRLAAAGMGRYAGALATDRGLRRRWKNGRLTGRGGTWHEPLLPVNMFLPAVAGSGGVEIAQLGSWDSRPGAPDAGATQLPAPTDPAPTDPAPTSPVPMSPAVDGSHEAQSLRVLRSPQHDAGGPSVAIARAVAPPDPVPRGLALAGDGAMALAAAAVPVLSGAMDMDLFTALAQGSGELGHTLAQALGSVLVPGDEGL